MYDVLVITTNKKKDQKIYGVQYQFETLEEKTPHDEDEENDRWRDESIVINLIPFFYFDYQYLGTPQKKV